MLPLIGEKEKKGKKEKEVIFQCAKKGKEKGSHKSFG